MFHSTLTLIINKLLLYAALCAALSGAAFADANIEFSGDVRGQPTYARPDGFDDQHSYVALPFTPIGSGPADLAWTADQDDFFDTYAYVYSGGFDPAAPGANLVTSNDDFNGSLNSSIHGFPLVDQQPYVIVTSTYGPGDNGAFTLNVNSFDIDGITITGDLVGFNGPIAVAQGTLRVVGGGNIGQASDLFVGSSIGGNAALSIVGGGTVSASTSVWLGGVSSSNGVGEVSGPGSSLSAGNIVVGRGGSGELTVTDGADVSVANGSGPLYIAYSSGSNGSVNIGAVAGQSAAAAGTIHAGNVIFGDGLGDQGVGSLVFNHTEANYDFNPAISGFGTILQSAGTTVLTGNSFGFTGITSITGGSLLVDGVLGSSLNVEAGGTLGGHGTLGSGGSSLVTVQNGGTLAPGNSIGTLTINGDLNFKSGSTYAVEITGSGTSDRTDVTGVANIDGGTVAVTALDAQTSYQNSQSYRILTAAGGLTGAFTNTVSSSAFLDASTVYDANNAYLMVGLKDTGETGPLFESVANTRNEISTARALDTLEQSGQSLALYNRLLVLNADQARAAYNQLSGEIHASAKAALIEDSHFIDAAMNDRLRAALGETPSSPIIINAYGPDDKVIAPGETNRYGAWGQAFGGWARNDSDGNAGSLDHSTGGFLAGIDGTLAQDWRLGFLAGYSHATFDSDGTHSSGSSDNYHVGVYGGSQWGPVSFRSGLAYTWHDIETDRSVAFNGFNENADADYNAGSFQAFGELGYRIDLQRASLEPFANLSYISLHTDSFEETGGASALAGDSETTNTTFTTVGVRASSDLTLGSVETSVRGAIGWRHAYGDTTPLSTASFAGSDAFTVAGVPIAEDTALIEAGIDFKLTPSAKLGFSYFGQFGSDASENAGKATLAVAF